MSLTELWFWIFGDEDEDKEKEDKLRRDLIELPQEVLWQVASNLQVPVFLRVVQTNSQFYDLAHDEQLWKHFFRRDLPNEFRLCKDGKLPWFVRRWRVFYINTRLLYENLEQPSFRAAKEALMSCSVLREHAISEKILEDLRESIAQHFLGDHTVPYAQDNNLELYFYVRTSVSTNWNATLFNDIPEEFSVIRGVMAEINWTKQGALYPHIFCFGTEPIVTTTRRRERPLERMIGVSTFPSAVFESSGENNELEKYEKQLDNDEIENPHFDEEDHFNYTTSVLIGKRLLVWYYRDVQVNLSGNIRLLNYCISCKNSMPKIVEVSMPSHVFCDKNCQKKFHIK